MKGSSISGILESAMKQLKSFDNICISRLSWSITLFYVAITAENDASHRASRNFKRRDRFVPESLQVENGISISETTQEKYINYSWQYKRELWTTMNTFTSNVLRCV